MYGQGQMPRCPTLPLGMGMRGMGGMGMRGMGMGPQMATEDRVPEGEVEVRRGGGATR